MKPHRFALSGKLPRDRRGAALIEFALVLPVLAALLLGSVSYGQYFLVAHSAQQLANDAARASIAGLNHQERVTIVTATVARGVQSMSLVSPGDVSTAIDEQGDEVTVTLRVDTRHMPLVGGGLIPLPDPIIQRRAVVTRGGIA